MSLAKARKMNPRQLATDVLAKLDVSEICEKVEIAGAGFLNFRLKNSALAQTLEAAAHGEHLFFDKAEQPKTVVIDFSSPNVAKPMHVGHIRSTGIGDALQRTLRLLGHRVISDNHIGDWGTQFGILILGWKKNESFIRESADPVIELERLYKTIIASKTVSADEAQQAKIEMAGTALDQARKELVALQSGDAKNVSIWKEIIALSQKQFTSIYHRLGVKFDSSTWRKFLQSVARRSRG